MATNKLLSELGLTEKEGLIYTTLLEAGRKTPAALSRLTNINRATVYSVGKSLQSKNLLAEDFAGKTRFFIPLPVENLKRLAEHFRQELVQKEQLIDEAIDELKLLQSSENYPVPKMRFIEEGDMEKFLYDNTKKWMESAIADDGVWWAFQDHTFAEHFEKWIDWTLTTEPAKRAGFKGQIVSNVSEIEKQMKSKHGSEHRSVRYLPDTKFTASIWVGGPFIVIVMTRNHPFYLFEIHDRLLASNLKEMIRMMWEQAIE